MSANRNDSPKAGVAKATFFQEAKQETPLDVLYSLEAMLWNGVFNTEICKKHIKDFVVDKNIEKTVLTKALELRRKHTVDDYSNLLELSTLPKAQLGDYLSDEKNPGNYAGLKVAQKFKRPEYQALAEELGLYKSRFDLEDKQENNDGSSSPSQAKKGGA